MPALPKPGKRNWSERALLIEAFIWLGIMRIAIGRVPFRHIVARLGLAQGTPGETAPALPSDQATRIGWAVRAAASRTPWQATCLAQGLAGIAMLRRRKIPAAIYLGMAKDVAAPESFAAHAWLRCGDVILTGKDECGRFSVISCFKSSGWGEWPK